MPRHLCVFAGMCRPAVADTWAAKILAPSASPLESMDAPAIFEVESKHARRQNLAWTSQLGHSGGNMNGDPSDIIRLNFNLCRRSLFNHPPRRTCQNRPK
jgi:hypothetical protein